MVGYVGRLVVLKSCVDSASWLVIPNSFLIALHSEHNRAPQPSRVDQCSRAWQACYGWLGLTGQAGLLCLARSAGLSSALVLALGAWDLGKLHNSLLNHKY